MNNKIKFIIGILLYLTMPILMACIIARLFMKNEGTILTIIFFSLIALELIAVVVKIIEYKKSKKEKIKR